MILIAESGSTKTDWRVLDKLGLVKSIKTIGINPYYQESADILKILEESELRSYRSSVDEIFYYGTGVTNQEKASIIEKALAIFFDKAKVFEIQSDVVGAARASCGKESGIACILGTGSNSIFFDGLHTGFQIPPLGFWLGDEGSGGHLGKTLILDYLHREMPTEIRGLFESEFGVMDRLYILEKAYHQPSPNRYFASFATFIHKNLSHEYCTNLVEKCMSEFFEKYILKYPMCLSTNVNFVGSIAYYFQDILRETSQKYHISIKNIVESPINGLVDYHLQN